MATNLCITMFQFLIRTGSGGGENTYNNLCVLPPNMLNQKFYSIWFIWLTALMIVSAVMLVLRLAIIFSSEIREIMLNLVYSVKITNVRKNSVNDTINI